MKVDTRNQVGNKLEIALYIHCAKCIQEKPANISPKDWSMTQAGWTPKGLQVWCNRHNCNILHIDFQGQKHPANTTTEGDE